jgi:hypothetical protein
MLLSSFSPRCMAIARASQKSKKRHNRLVSHARCAGPSMYALLSWRIWNTGTSSLESFFLGSSQMHSTMILPTATAVEGPVWYLSLFTRRRMVHCSRQKGTRCRRLGVIRLDVTHVFLPRSCRESRGSGGCCIRSSSQCSTDFHAGNLLDMPAESTNTSPFRSTPPPPPPPPPPPSQQVIGDADQL